MFINKKPEIGEIRYFAFLSDGYEYLILKVSVLRRWTNKTTHRPVVKTEIKEVILNSSGYYKVGYDTTIDYIWQLQKSEEDAKRLLILGLFGKGFYKEEAPF